MIDLSDIESLTRFHRDRKFFLNTLKRTGRPLVLTLNGRAVLVVQDAQAYQRTFSRNGKPNGKPAT